ncbi:MAG: hypothetical protein IKA61_05360 [Clostridia bacterium]|nr:hypothetical protein [Clostridia bacterium]
MNYLDTLYRAFLEYRKETKDNNALKKQRKSIIRANEAEDKIEITQTKCIIESDWIEAIEQGLDYVDKAIREERQFIRSNGEVVPIEKAKNVGKESVEHLARHSQYLTKEPEEGGDIIPDQIYTVERLTDYAVYENRFLYMLLCYLRDFIALRYNKILDLTNTYSGNMTMNKLILSDKSRINYSVTLKEERKDDEYLKTHNESKDIISRIDLIYKIVMRFLATPLMDEVSKAPMLRPPITKTNVLKMNNNFKHAVALYEFVTSYNKDGFTIEKSVKTIHPFSEELADEMSESVILSSFLTYYHGLGIKDYLKENYEEENRVRREIEAKKKDELIKRLQRQVKEQGGDPYEYILELEDRMRFLREDCEEFARVRADLAVKVSENEDLRVQKAQLETEIINVKKEYDDRIYELIQSHNSEIENIHLANSLFVEQLRQEHIATVDHMKQLEQENIERINIEHANEIDEIKTSMGETIKELREKASALSLELAQTISDTKAQIQQLRNQHAYEIGVMKNETQEKVNSYNKLWEDHTLLKARYNAVRKESGKMTDPKEFATREAFDDIEHQYNVFKKFFKGEWREMKKRIRKDVFDGFGQELKEEMANKDGKKTSEQSQVSVQDEVAATKAENLSDSISLEKRSSILDKHEPEAENLSGGISLEKPDANKAPSSGISLTKGVNLDKSKGEAKVSLDKGKVSLDKGEERQVKSSARVDLNKRGTVDGNEEE